MPHLKGNGYKISFLHPMQIFYSSQVEDGYLYLDENETHHCMRVLRKRTGDLIEVVDGKGNYFTGVIEEVSKRAMIRIETQEDRSSFRKHRIHLAVAPTKNIDRMEWMTEKVTEIGVDEISFIHCENSERKILRPDRLSKKTLSAMKQSGQAVLPQLNEMKKYSGLFENITEKGRYIAHLDEHVESIPMSNMAIKEDSIVLIGPEGGFSSAEVSMALENGFIPVTLGKTRLRTETAAVVACTILNLSFV